MNNFVFLYLTLKRKCQLNKKPSHLFFLPSSSSFFRRPVYSLNPYMLFLFFFISWGKWKHRRLNQELLWCFFCLLFRKKNRQCEEFTLAFKLPIHWPDLALTLFFLEVSFIHCIIFLSLLSRQQIMWARYTYFTNPKWLVFI